jgi:membrane protease YdiL (CAAX protease family)
MAAYAWSQGRLDIPWTTAVLFLVYPAWGLVQQLLVQGVLVQQMRAQPNLGRRPWLVALIAGAFFGVVHWPFPLLMVATALMGTAFAFIYMRYQNLWPLGIAHGWLGALFFLWVMDKDPMALTLAAAQVM